MSDDVIKLDFTSELPRESGAPAIGTWYWVTGENSRWLGCVTHVGTNYVELTSPGGGNTRVHFDAFHTTCAPESQPEAYIEERVTHYQDVVRGLMTEVAELTRRLSVNPNTLAPEGAGSLALAVVSQAPDVETYKNALVRAQKVELPKLFKAIEEANESVAMWMKAKMLPLKASAGAVKSVVDRIENQIFNVELYAGLVEKVQQIAGGEPAAYDAPVHLMQRRAYMDEECLANYSVGGMSFEDVGAFDRWIARPSNRDRILPHPRCVIAFRVRRHDKEYDWQGDIAMFFRMMNYHDWDKSTFLYLRNGEQLFRLETQINFDEKLFPDLDHHILKGEKLYAEYFVGVGKELITEGDYFARVAAYNAKVVEHEAAVAAYKKLTKSARKSKLEPWFHESDPASRWEPFVPSSVYYDDIAKVVQAQITAHNRIVVVLQGLLDRSPVLNPHPRWSLWTEEGFRDAVRLVYDADRALTSGSAPDFEAYRARLNASLKVGSVTVGQEVAWERYEAAKENKRRDNDWRRQDRYRVRRWMPTGDPGPGVLARVARVAGDRVSYTWMRERQRRNFLNDKVRATFRCSTRHVLNVSAYTPGDYRIFFADPRTRADYLQWAPLLLEAEEYHAGNHKLGADDDK